MTAPLSYAGLTPTDLAIVEKAFDIANDDSESRDVIERNLEYLLPQLQSIARQPFCTDAAHILWTELQALMRKRAAAKLSPMGRALGRLEHYTHPEVVEARIQNDLDYFERQHERDQERALDAQENETTEG